MEVMIVFFGKSIFRNNCNFGFFSKFYSLIESIFGYFIGKFDEEVKCIIWWDDSKVYFF